MDKDRILLRGLRVMAYCGALEEEQQRRQPFEVNAELVVDLRAAGHSDALEDTVHYGIVGDNLAELVETHRFTLLEFFAHKIAEVLLADERVSEAVVEVLKLRPPMAQDLTASGVRITRRRDD